MSFGNEHEEKRTLPHITIVFNDICHVSCIKALVRLPWEIHGLLYLVSELVFHIMSLVSFESGTGATLLAADLPSIFKQTPLMQILTNVTDCISSSCCCFLS